MKKKKTLSKLNRRLLEHNLKTVILNALNEGLQDKYSGYLGSGVDTDQGSMEYGEFGGEGWQSTFDDEMAEYEPDVKFSPTDLKKQGGGRPSKLEMRLMHMYGLTANSTGDVNDIQYKKCMYWLWNNRCF